LSHRNGEQSVDSDNAGLLSEKLWATAFTAHPYQWPVLGWMVDIQNWKMEDLKRHFEMGYSPSMHDGCFRQYHRG